MDTLLNSHLNQSRLHLSSPTRHLFIRYIHAPTRFSFVMPKLISSNLTTNQFRHRRLLSFIVNSHMETNKSPQPESTANDSKPKEEEKSPPPPPEKPEPGDCCGSGCVRCVWDVYYEELEEYNKLYNSRS